jgi:ribA/ribD-fused uncharacterized protein
MSDFTIQNQTYRNVEQFFQAEKARFANDMDVFHTILQSSNPRVARTLGRKVHELPVAAWNAARDPIMLQGVRAKFSQNESLKALLVGTGDAVLIEDSPTDYYWGCGFKKTGQNKLGKTLMIVRQELHSS